MTRTRFVVLTTFVVLATSLPQAQTTPQTAPKPSTRGQPQTKPDQTATGAALGSVHIPKKVTADGQPLAAGTYTLRVSNEAVKPVVGQAPDSSKWVEFVQGGQVKGRELATVLTSADAKEIAKRGTPPASGAVKVETLKGNEYLRVWVNRGGTHYLIHLTAAS